jgi:hypothetical protein
MPRYWLAYLFHYQEILGRFDYINWLSGGHPARYFELASPRIPGCTPRRERA